MNDIHEECGVFGVYGIKDASNIVYYGLHSLQHRGQEGCGIVSVDNGEFHKNRGLGLVNTVFDNNNMKKMVGNMSIGHVRYSTAGGGGIENVQPFAFHHYTGDFALCHNGNIVNSELLHKELEIDGSIFRSTSDTEIIAHLIKKNKKESTLEAIIDALNKIEGSFSLLLLTQNKLYGARDKYGIRPLSLGKLNGGYVLSSETCAFEVCNVEFIRDIKPGEIVVIDNDGIKSYYYNSERENKMCAMEYIYFSRPDSDIEGINVHSFRKESGKELYYQNPTEADIVIGVPDSSLSAAIGYAEASKIPYEMGLIKNKYVGRTFIEPSQELREKGVKMKLSAVKSIVNGKRVILIDDSVVRGTTSKKIVTLLRDAGALEVHVRIASPQIINPCFYGVDTSTYEELISARMSLEDIKKTICADSLDFLNIESLYKCAKRSELCVACFTGKYPTPLFSPINEANKKIK